MTKICFIQWSLLSSWNINSIYTEFINTLSGIKTNCYKLIYLDIFTQWIKLDNTLSIEKKAVIMSWVNEQNHKFPIEFTYNLSKEKETIMQIKNILVFKQLHMILFSHKSNFLFWWWCIVNQIFEYKIWDTWCLSQTVVNSYSQTNTNWWVGYQAGTISTMP